MGTQPDYPDYSINWGVRFLCDCRKSNLKINLHNGVAHRVSTTGAHILSDHHICGQKKVAMQLMIPSLIGDAPHKIVKIIGKSLNSIMQEGKYLTEIEFLHFEENGLKELEKNLRHCFDRSFFTQTAQRA